MTGASSLGKKRKARRYRDPRLRTCHVTLDSSDWASLGEDRIV